MQRPFFETDLPSGIERLLVLRRDCSRVVKTMPFAAGKCLAEPDQFLARRYSSSERHAPRNHLFD
jgi:hypothetical protein